MLPVLFRIPMSWTPWGDEGSYFPIRMFGVMVILGFLAGTWLVGRRLEKRGILERQESFDFCFYLLAMGIAGSRLLYVLQNFSDFKGKFFKVFAIWEGGLVWYGGFAAAAIFAFLWLNKRKLPVLQVTDAAALGLALALAIGRWGCFCAGDDYGAKILGPDGLPIESADAAPWYAVQFPLAEGRGADSAWPHYEYGETPGPLDAESFRAPYWLHPAQLYMSLSNFAVLGLLLAGSRLKWALGRPGFISALYLLIYPIGRFTVELWRGDLDRGTDVMGTGLSFSQAFGIPVFLCGIMLMRKVLSKPPQTA
jgi:phosphatidylglycerol:prolipoprotein diacylglycerol transferase